MATDKDKKTRIHLRNKWSHLKRQLKQRQLLFYKAKIPIELINDYLTKTPTNEEILRIESVIYKDREEKTRRIRNAILLDIGHLKSTDFGKILGTSDTTIRDILSGKKKCASYDLIDRIELYLNQNFSFETSLENSLTVKDFLNKESDEIIAEINLINQSLQKVPASIKKIIDKGEYEYYSTSLTERKYKPTPIDSLNQIRIELDKLTQKLKYKLDSFIIKNVE